MEKKIKEKSATKKIPPLHTMLIEQYIQICQRIKIDLVSGSAQIFGVELKKNYPHQFTIPCSIPVFSWQGAQIRILWTQYENTQNSQQRWVDLTHQANQMESAPMMRYLQIHYNLLGQRKLALQQCRVGPRVAVVGTQDSAAHNISKLLLNYSGKYSMNPIFIDLDPESSIFIDGSIGTLQFEYKISQDLFDRPSKLCFYYGNRTIRSKTYLNQIEYLYECVNKKLQRQIKDYKLHGTKDEYPYFASGVVVQLPKYRQSEYKSKNDYFDKIKGIIGIINCTHLISVDFPEMETYINNQGNNKNTVQLIKGRRLEGTQSYLLLPRPLRSKIERYFNNQSTQVKYKIEDITIYELMTESATQPAYCRTIDIKNQAISKNTVAVLHAKAKKEDNLDSHALYRAALVSPICCLIRISNIEVNEILLEVGQQHFLEEFGDHIWVTSVTDQ